MKQKPVFLRSEKDKGSKYKGKINVYVDSWLLSELLDYLSSDKARKREFDKRVNYIVKDITTTEIFKQENFKGGIDVWAIRIMGGRKGGKLNDRLYCKMYNFNGIKHIIIAHIYIDKKVQGLNQELRNIITKVNEYEYQIED